MTSDATRVISKLLLAPTFMIAFAVLIKGYVDVGDGFSAGVIVSLGILLQYAAFGPKVAGQLPGVRLAPRLAMIGLLITLIVAFVPMFFGEPPMTHFPGPGERVIHIGTLEVLTAVAFDIGVFLLVAGFGVGSIELIASLIQRTERAEP